MADPLLLLAYGAARFFEKGRREDAADAQALATQQKAQQEEQAANVVHEWGYTADDTDKTFLTKRQPGAVGHGKGWTTTRRRIGGKNKDIKEVSPNTEQSQKLYQDETGTIDFMSAFEDKRSVFGTMPNLTHVGFGFRNKDGKLEPNYFPDHLAKKAKPSKEKNVFLFRGVDTDDNTVYGATKANVEAKAKPGSVSQVSLSPTQIRSVAPDIDVAALPTAKVDPVTVSTPKGEGKRLRYVVTNPNSGERLYFKTFNDAIKAGHLKKDIKSQEVEGPQDAPVVVGGIKIIGKEDTTKVTMMVDAVKKGFESEGSNPITLEEYNSNPGVYTPTGQAYELNPDTDARVSKPGAILSISDAKNAIKSSQAFYRSPKYTNALNKEERFEVPLDTQTSGKPATQLRLMTQWINSGTLPRKEGKVDWQQAGYDEAGLNDLVKYLGVTMKQETQLRTSTGERITPARVVRNTEAYVKANYPDLYENIPFLKDELRMQLLLEKRKAHNYNKVLHERSLVGTVQNTLTANVPVTLPPEISNGQPGDAGVPVMVPFPVPFNAKFNKDVQLVLQTVAPNATVELNVETGDFEFKGGSDSDYESAVNVVKDLVVYEYEADGTTPKKGPNGQVIISEKQPNLEFVNYLRTSTEVDGTPYYATWRKLVGGEGGSDNEQVNASVKRRFSETHGGDFDKGTAIIKAFMPSNLGTESDAFLYAQITGKSVDALDKEREGRIQQADSAAMTVTTFNQMEQTFFTDDGKFIDMNTFMGNLYVGLDGAMYMFRQLPFVDRLLQTGGLKQLNDSQAFDIAKNQLIGQDSNGRRYFNSILDNATDERIEELAKAEGMNVVAYRERELKARQENMASLDRPPSDGGIQGIDSKNEVIKNLALRNFYRYMVAYQMAAAIQGGTGGRTVSDQDVQNILKALKLNAPMGKASTELTIIRAARKLLVGIEKHSRAVGNGGENAYAALTFQALSIGTTPGKLTSSMIASKLAVAGPAGTDNNSENSTQMSDQEKLDKINQAQGKFADTYNTLEDAVKALGKNTVAVLLSN